MATARLWWTGSSWSSSSAYWKNETTGSASSDYALVRYQIQIIAYDDGTIKLSAKLWAAQGAVYGSPEIYSGTKTVKSGSTTIGTGTFTADVTNYTAFSYSGNVATRCWWNGQEYYGAQSTTSGSTTITNPFLTLAYNANGGSGAPASQNACSGVAVIISNDAPSKTGASFLGWSTNSSATTATYHPGDSITITANTTLYAVWGTNSAWEQAIPYIYHDGNWVPAMVTAINNST